MEYENISLGESIEILEEVLELDDSIYAYNRKYRMALEFVIDCIKRDMTDSYIKRDTLLKLMRQYEGQDLYNAILYLEDADVSKYSKRNGTSLNSDYDKLMTISQQLAFENEECREKIEKIKTEIDNEWANTHHMYPDYASGLACASEIIDRCIGKVESEVKPNEV